VNKGPDFLCIGAEKAGTTWLYDNIRLHPEVWLPPPPFKELHYFDDKVPHKDLLHLGRFDHGGIIRRYSPLFKGPNWKTARWLWRFNHHHNDSMHWYRSLFPDSGIFSGDITPTYSTLDDRGVEYARQVVGNKCRILLILRDPVSRSWSAVKMLYRYKGMDIKQIDESSIIQVMQSTHNLLSTNYTRTIKTWRAYFDAEMFKIFYFDDLVADNAAFLRAIYRHIGVKNSDWVSPKMNKSSNRDREEIKMPAGVKTSISRFYIPELEELSQMIGGHAVSWLRKAEETAAD